MKFKPHDLTHLSTYIHRGYVKARLTSHPNVNRGGYVFYHRLVVENVLGRYLTSTEFVHHVDENTLNNDPYNLEVVDAQKGHWEQHRSAPPIRRCVFCGSDFEVTERTGDRYSARKCCSSACTKEQRKRAQRQRQKLRNKKVPKPSKEELAKLVWSLPATKIGERLGVSSNTVAKWCRGYSITKPGRGYWQKIRAGK